MSQYPGHPGNNPQYPHYPPQYPPSPVYPQNTYMPPGAPQPYPNLYPQVPGFNIDPIRAMSYPGAQAAPSAPAAPYPGVAPTPVYPGVGYPAPSLIEWVPSNCASAEILTQRAVVAGYEGHDGSPLWIIRAHYEGDLIPGKLAIKHKSAYVPWGGKENSVQQFEVCCAPPTSVKWVEGRNGTVPPNAVPGGRTSTGETLYIGRAKERGSLTPGKIHTTHKTCYISFAGDEISHPVYEVLCVV